MNRFSSHRPATDDVDETTGPHARLKLAEPHLQVIAGLFDRLWGQYCRRVQYARAFNDLLGQAGLSFVNDHIAFRTIGMQQPYGGLASVARPLEALGYQPAACYSFPDKHLNAVHLHPPHPELPKIFVSELQTWKLSDKAQAIIRGTLSTYRPQLSLDLLTQLHRLREPASGRSKTATKGDATAHSELVNQLVRHFTGLPWDPPQKNDVVELNRESQYAAWVLVHGYNVNHFTASVNAQRHRQWDTLEKTVQQIRQAGIPVKSEIEGAAGSKLRQSATEAVVIDVPVLHEGNLTTMPWAYAYLEFADRGSIIDPETGKSIRFEGFLGGQATHLFEMTKRL